MTDLTEQWKKGELPEGVYYVLYYKNDTAEVDIYRRVYSLYDDSEVRFTIPQVTKVIAPVPSYEEWQKLKEFADYSIHNRDELTRQINFWMQENTKLKELLKECQGSIATLLSKRITEVNGIKQKELLAKINQALGEDK